MTDPERSDDSDGGADADSDEGSGYTAVLDRFERDAEGVELAVLVLERGGDAIRDLPVPVEQLPDAACHDDAVLRVRVVNDTLDEVTYDREATERRAKSAQERFDRLSDREE
jgi:hypothetical protein